MYIVTGPDGPTSHATSPTPGGAASWPRRRADPSLERLEKPATSRRRLARCASWSRLARIVGHEAPAIDASSFADQAAKTRPSWIPRTASMHRSPIERLPSRIRARRDWPKGARWTSRRSRPGTSTSPDAVSRRETLRPRWSKTVRVHVGTKQVSFSGLSNRHAEASGIKCAGYRRARMARTWPIHPGAEASGRDARLRSFGVLFGAPMIGSRATAARTSAAAAASDSMRVKPAGRMM